LNGRDPSAIAPAAAENAVVGFAADSPRSIAADIAANTAAVTDLEVAWVRHEWPRTAQTARTARRHFRSALDAAGIGAEVGINAELVLAELVANAVSHGVSDAEDLIQIAWRLSADWVQVSVYDSGHADQLAPGDLAAASAAGDDSGRGLALVDLLSDRWSWSSDHGTYVAAELRLPRPR
jgi:serine/threonine-protein kinase RsbW